MKKINKDLIIINISILSTIIMVLILAILYKCFSYKNDIEKNLETSVKVQELYNNTNNTTVEEEKRKDINSNTNDWELLLVNKKHKIPDGYGVNLEEIELVHKIDYRIADKLKEMLLEARKEGLDPIICSSYRTNKKQKMLYNNKVKEHIKMGYNNEEAEELASFWVAIPGTGEHETGLAVDIVSEKYQILDEKQEETEVQKWLIENSYKYGFVLRYPTNKRDITMINYEPWHYRYVGVENATYMKENNMCLEEFIDYLKQFESDTKELI